MDYPYLSSPSVAVLSVSILLWFSYIIGLAIYRLYFSPLSSFPGPKLAGLTRWYEFYYDVVLQGQFTFRIQKMHEKYGPIVRITPFELHVDDSDYWDELYSRTARYDKYEWLAGRFGANTMTFTTSKSDHHAIRRAPLNPMFSKRSIAKFEPVIKDKVELMCKAIRAHSETGEVLVLSDAFSAFSGDVITEYCFGFCYNHLESPGFKENFHPTFMALAKFSHLVLQFPLVFPIMKALPDWVTETIAPDLHMLLVLQKDLKVQIAKISKTIAGGDRSQTQPQHPTIFHELLQSNLPAHEKSLHRLGDEAQQFIGAGLTTAAWALSTLTYHLLANPPILRTLRAELDAAIPDPAAELDALSLERLPYLGACIQEALRLAYGVTSRNPRISPDKPTKYKDWLIPAGTPVSMTITDVHRDERVYPASRAFVPARWLGSSPRTADGAGLARYFVAFGKGPRSCIGINLAHTELFLVAAAVFRRFTFELYETDASDFELAHDFFLPHPKLDTKGLRVTVTSTAF